MASEASDNSNGVPQLSGGNSYPDLPQMSPLRDQDRFLPIANISKIMKKSIDCKSGKIAKETKERVQECISEFISFITSEAAEKCILEKRKTINGDDLIFAMRTLGFENYVNPLTVFLHKYRETNKLEMSPGNDTSMTDANANSMMLNVGGGIVKTGNDSMATFVPVYTSGNPNAVAFVMQNGHHPQ